MALIQYMQDYDEMLPHHAGDTANFLLPAAVPNWARAIMPYSRNEQMLICPSAPIDPRQGALAPTINRTSFQGNGVVLSRLGKSSAAIPAPSDIVFMQENYFTFLVAFNRPSQINAATATPQQYRWWHLVDCRPVFSMVPRLPRERNCCEQYNSRHFTGGSILFVDGHAKFRNYYTMRSGEFGLVPDEPYREDQTQSFCTAGGACAGTIYTPAF